MKYKLNKIVAGIGVAGLLGTGAIAEDTQAQRTYEPQQSQSGMSGSRETASTAKTAQMGQHQSRGRIRSLDPSSQTLSLRGVKMHRDFAWSNNTQVLRNGKPVSADELKKGERVRVTYRKEGGKLIADQIVIKERQQARAGRQSHQ